MTFLPLYEGGTRPPRLKLYNEGSMNGYNAWRITHINYLLQLSSPTSENSVTAKFAEFLFYVVG